MNEIAIAVEAIKNAVLRSQYQAAKDVNRVQLALYFGVGRFLFSKKGKRTWGTKVLESISTKLRNELPGLHGFSAENLKKMRQFYENWQFLDSSDLTNTIQKLPVRRNSVVATTELEKSGSYNSRIHNQCAGFSFGRFFQCSFPPSCCDFR